MDRVPVESSVIAEVGYSPSLQTLEILFRCSAIRLYYFVPQAGQNGLMASEYKSVYFNRYIKGVYESYRISEPEKPRGKVRPPLD
jgi:hypothetical protein